MLVMDPPLELGEAVFVVGVIGDLHEVGQDGASGLELDGLGLGALGQAADLVGGGGGMAAEPSDGALEGAALDAPDPLADVG
jgi:hypothetical protein